MLIFVADDKKRMLGFVKRWFNRRYSSRANIRLETHDDLESLESFIKSKLPHDDKFLVLLDLNWGDDKASSLDWIKRIKKTVETRHWPVIVYSESDSPVDVREAHMHFANGYVHKGVERQEEHFIEILEHWRKNQMLPVI